MKTNSQFWVIGLFSLCLWACGDNDASSGGDNPVMHDIPIGFTSSVVSEEEASTRGGVITDVSDMYVFASYTGKSDWATTDMTNFMYMQKMTKASGSGWTYSPLKYWPNNDKDKISFFAYAPANITGIVPSAVNVAGPKLTYSIPTIESDKQDLVVSSCLNRKNGDGVIAFTMKHVLTQLKIRVKNTNPNIGEAVLKGVEVLMPGTATLCFNNTDNIFVWTSYGEQTVIKADELLGGDKTIVLTEAPKEVATFFLFAMGDPSSLVKLRLTYTVKKAITTEEPVTLIVPVSLPANPIWSQGTGVTYTVSIADGRLEVEDVTVIADFTEENTGITGDITAT